MGLQQKIHFESGLLTVDATGEFSLEEAKQAFLEMLAAVAQYQAEKVLFDGRNLKGKPEHIERFYYGYFAAIETVKLMAKYPMPALHGLHILSMSLFVTREGMGKP